MLEVIENMKGSIMIDIRPFSKLGQFRNQWLEARYHFNFSHYHQDGRNGWGDLLVWNDDIIKPNTGFDLHGHQNMEIITYIREGALTHRDNQGNEGTTRAGDVQVMSAGRGIRHEEHNLGADPIKVFQVWIAPKGEGGDPYWETAEFPKTDRAGELIALASGQPEYPNALPIRADATLFGATLKQGQALEHPIDSDRHGYLVSVKGRITVNDIPMDPQDGAAIEREDNLQIRALEDAEIILADVR
jgi:redox-sensitive bicupin YhaK (pirin superfamily)